MNGQIRAGKYPGQDLPPSIRENFEDMKLVKDEDEIISCFLEHKKSVERSNKNYCGIKDLLNLSPDLKDSQDIANEESVGLFEGDKMKVSTSKILKNFKIMLKCKIRDNFKCRACGFHYNNSIVHAHHMIPFTEKGGRRVPNPEELITLCPTCHALAHDILKNVSDKKLRNNTRALIDEINKIRSLTSK